MTSPWRVGEEVCFYFLLSWRSQWTWCEYLSFSLLAMILIYPFLKILLKFIHLRHICLLPIAFSFSWLSILFGNFISDFIMGPFSRLTLKTHMYATLFSLFVLLLFPQFLRYWSPLFSPRTTVHLGPLLRGPSWNSDRYLLVPVPIHLVILILSLALLRCLHAHPFRCFMPLFHSPSSPCFW